MSSKCFLHSFLIVVIVGKHDSNKIPTPTPSVKGTGSVRNWREAGRPVLLYELLFFWVLLLPLPARPRGVQLLSRLPVQLSSPAASWPKIWAK